MDSLVNQAIPGISFPVFERSIAKRTPFLEQHSGGVLSAKVGAECGFKTAAKDHRRARVFFPPAIEIPISVATRTTKVLANLCVAVSHWNCPSPHEFHCRDPAAGFPTQRPEQTHRDSESSGR